MSPIVLIVDDSLTVRMDLAAAFDTAGFSCIAVDCLRDAREVLAREQVDLVVLDVMLPDGNGVDLLREIRERAVGMDLPVLMLSSESEVRDRVRGLRTGASDYVGKPYDAAHVVGRARELTAPAFRAAAERLSILLIDDSATFRAMLSELLLAEGLRVTAVETAEEGLRHAALTIPSAILVDGVLPGMDGASLIRRVRLDSELRSVPCVLMTAADEASVELHALDSGADAFVRKDSEPELIIAKLRAVLRNAAATRGERGAARGPHRILAVDDSATFRRHIAEALAGEGYEVVLAESGEQALELLSVQPVDCVLLDVMMPGLSGREVCARMKAQPHLRDVPVLILTALEDRASMIDLLAAGADDYLEKTAELSVLKARVRAQLRRRQFEEETRRVRERLLRSELETSQARAAQEIAETRAAAVEALGQKNRELVQAMQELRAAQGQLVQSAKMASLGALVAGVAHEINNPLAFVISHLETAQSDMDHLHKHERVASEGFTRFTRARSRIAETKLGLDRIRDLVIKLRTFSRLDEGEHKTVSVRECVESLLTILEHRMRDRIAVETHFGEPEHVACFPSLLTQAIMNVVANAIDAIDDEGTICIRTGADGDQFRIVISDTGRGVPAEIRERIFDPFFTTKPVGEGTGLGLSITDSIVRKHGGTLSLRDAAPRGTEITISIPWTHE